MNLTENSGDARLQDLWQAYRADPEAYETNRDLGLRLSETEQFKLDAFPLLIKALSFERRDQASRHMIDRLGVICRLTGHFAGAVMVYRQGVRLFPEAEDFALRLGDALVATGEVEEAQVYYPVSTRQAVPFGPRGGGAGSRAGPSAGPLSTDLRLRRGAGGAS